MFKAIPELKVRLTASTVLPDPTHIQSASEWYYLDHVSSGLVIYDADKQKFSPLFAESWNTEANGTHRFFLRKNIMFHNGNPITAKDIIWSIKRHLIFKRSTHFALWEYIVGCENIKTLLDECEGLKAVSDHEIVFQLKSFNESFFLQLASPETGIWAASDMNPETAELKASSFSGAYFLSEKTDKEALLKRNENSPISERFPDSPRSIRLMTHPISQLNQALIEKKVDLAIRSYSPFGEPDWEKAKIKVKSTTASNIFYLFGLGTGQRPAIGQDFIKTLWNQNKDPNISQSESYLPFNQNYSLSREEFLESLPQTTAKRIRVFCPEGFFPKEFLDEIKTAAESVGTTMEFYFAPPQEWFNAFNDPSAGKKYDYMLSLYAASERYPAVQLRYMTKQLVRPPVDLKEAETPDLNDKKIQILKDYQKWLLESHQAVPLFFGNTLFLHQPHLDLGKQSETDAEIELWRVREKVL